MPVPKPPGTAALLPRAIGKKRSRARCPVSSGTSARRRSRTGRARRTGQWCARVISAPAMRATGSPTVSSPAGAIQSTAAATRRDAHPVRDRRGLGHLSQDTTPLRPCRRSETSGVNGPAPLALERYSAPSVAQRLARPGEPAQHAVEDAAEKPRPELGPQGMARAHDGVSGPEPARVRVHLNRGGAPVEGDHLARQPIPAHLDELEHARSEIVDLDDGPVDAADVPGAHRHSLSSSSPSDAIARSASAGSV